MLTLNKNVPSPPFQPNQTSVFTSWVLFQPQTAPLHRRSSKRSFPPEYYYIILTKNEIHALHHQTLTPILLKYRKRQVTHTTHVLSSTKHLSCISQHVFCRYPIDCVKYLTCLANTQRVQLKPEKCLQYPKRVSSIQSTFSKYPAYFSVMAKTTSCST